MQETIWNGERFLVSRKLSMSLGHIFFYFHNRNGELSLTIVFLFYIFSHFIYKYVITTTVLKYLRYRKSTHICICYVPIVTSFCIMMQLLPCSLLLYITVKFKLNITSDNIWFPCMFYLDLLCTKCAQNKKNYYGYFSINVSNNAWVNIFHQLPFKIYA